MQVYGYDNHLVSKEYDMAALQNTIAELQGKIRNLKKKLIQAVPTGKWGTAFIGNPNSEANPNLNLWITY